MSSSELTQAHIDTLTERGTKFLGAASQVPAIRAALERGGYNEAEHGRGWELLLELLGFKNPTLPEVTGEQQRQREAVAELDAYDGPAFDRARAALEHRFPAQAAYVFEGLSARSGTESIGAVRTFVDRVAALRDGSDSTRTATRAEDAAAAALLAARRIIDGQEEQRLRGLIGEATRLAHAPSAPAADPTRRQRVARELELWLRDWRETGRVLVTRRDHQIRLGLAERRSPSAPESRANDA
jgi:hypothetical protein